MISYMSVSRKEEDVVVCEVEMVRMEESADQDCWRGKIKMVNIPIKKFTNCGPVNEGDIFVIEHNSGEVAQVCRRDDEEKARRAAEIELLEEEIIMN